MGRTMFNVRWFKAKNRVFKFDYQKEQTFLARSMFKQKMMFYIVCFKMSVLVLLVMDPLSLMIDVCSFEAKKKGVRVRLPIPT